jgi:UDP-2,4-diacetamido-2,4,6-trideoxy-beta-L-altropyranose hydrolase
VLFFADAGAEVGGGHVMRCLTLARVLVDRGAECAFVESRAAAPILRRFGWPDETVLAMIGAEELPALLAYAGRIAELFEPDVVVIDHYRIGARQGAAMRRADRRIVVIDDLADRPLDADLIVDPSFGRKPEAYRGQAPEGARVVTGPAYALVRPEFASARPRAMSRRAKHGPVGRALVSLGLTDVGGVSWRVVQTLLPRLGDMRLDVVVGQGAQSLPALRRAAGADRRLRLLVDHEEMGSLMADADAGVGAGGSSVWERAVVGLPAVTLSLASNQRPMLALMAEAGLTLAADPTASDFAAELATAWGRLLADAGLRWRLASRSSELCDGHGAERVADAVLELQTSIGTS